MAHGVRRTAYGTVYVAYGVKVASLRRTEKPCMLRIAMIETEIMTEYRAQMIETLAGEEL
jgi:hypothetical protein